MSDTKEKWYKRLLQKLACLLCCAGANTDDEEIDEVRDAETGPVQDIETGQLQENETGSDTDTVSGGEQVETPQDLGRTPRVRLMERMVVRDHQD